MTISELIHKLRDARRVYGDLRIVIYDDFGWKDPTTDDVRPTDIILYDQMTGERKTQRVDALRL